MSAALVAGLILLLGAALPPTSMVSARRPERSLGNAPPASRTPRWGGVGGQLAQLTSWLSTRRSVVVDDDELAQWSSAVAAAVRSGDSLAAAMVNCPRPPSLTGALQPVVFALQRGAGVHDAIGAARGVAPGLDTLVGVIRMCAITGGGAAEPLDRVASAARARSTSAAELRSHSAQSRLSALVLTVLPGAVLVLLASISPSTRAALSTVGGLASISVGAVLNLAGWWWMRSILEAQQ